MYYVRREGTCPTKLLKDECRVRAEREGKEFDTEVDADYPVGCYEYFDYWVGYEDIVVLSKANEGYSCNVDEICLCKQGNSLYLVLAA